MASLVTLLLVVVLGGAMLVGALIGWSIKAVRERDATRRHTLLTIARHLDAVAVDAASGITGRRGGWPVSLMFQHRADGDGTTPWTELVVELRGLAVTLDLRRETGAERELRDRGLVVDLQTGDAGFDDAFIIEAAPQDLIFTVLDDELRAQLLEMPHARVVYRPRQGVCIEVGGWTDATTTLALIELGVGFARRLAEAAASEVAAAAVVPAGAPYRGDDGAALAEREARNAAERARVDEVKARRTEHIVAQGHLALVVAGVGLAVVLAATVALLVR